MEVSWAPGYGVVTVTSAVEHSKIVIGSLVLSRVISFHVVFGPMLKSRVSTTFDHECEITLAIRAAIPDLIKDTNRAGSGLPHGKMVRVALTGEAGLARKDTHPITAGEAPLQIERPVR
jgi:hypothetical protein